MAGAQTQEKIPKGYYIKARVIEESWVSHQPPCVREIWDWLMRNAKFCEQKVNGVQVKRGQLLKSYKEIREGLAWYVGFRKEMYSEDATKKAMKKLRSHLMIATTKAPGGVLITIENYDYYQDPRNYESTDEGTPDGTTLALRKHHGGTKGSDLPLDDNENSGPKEGLKNGKNGESKSKPLPKPRPKKDEARTELNREVWESYKNAFFQRYGVEPIRNAKINGMISKYTQRLPAAEAAAVAAYYVFHQGNLYVQSKHCVDLLLRDAEKLRADWATGTQTTQKPRSKILEALAEANRLTGVSDETEGSPRLSGGNSFQLRLPR